MFIIDINYTVSLEEVNKYMEAHAAYLKKYTEQSVFLISGKKVPWTGGILVANAGSKEEAERIVAEDPFHQNKVAEMTITEFLHARHNRVLDGLLGESV